MFFFSPPLQVVLITFSRVCLLVFGGGNGEKERGNGGSSCKLAELLEKRVGEIMSQHSQHIFPFPPFFEKSAEKISMKNELHSFFAVACFTCGSKKKLFFLAPFSLKSSCPHATIAAPFFPLS